MGKPYKDEEMKVMYLQANEHQELLLTTYQMLGGKQERDSHSKSSEGTYPTDN